MTNSNESMIPNDKIERSALKLRDGTIYWTESNLCHQAILQHYPIYLSEVASCGWLVDGVYHDNPDDAMWLIIEDLIYNGTNTLYKDLFTKNRKLDS